MHAKGHGWAALGVTERIKMEGIGLATVSRALSEIHDQAYGKLRQARRYEPAGVFFDPVWHELLREKLVPMPEAKSSAGHRRFSDWLAAWKPKYILKQGA
jgi:hypothetical protein